MNKFTFGGGISMAMAAFALSATVALACPPPTPKPPSAPPPPPCAQPCPPPPPPMCASLCVNPNAMIWGTTSTQQGNSAQGLALVDVEMSTLADTGVKINAGTNTAETNVWAGQHQIAWDTTSANQVQATNSGASVIYPWNFQPAKVTAQGFGNSAQAQAIFGTMPMQEQDSMIHGQYVTGDSSSLVASDLNMNNSASGRGALTQQQANMAAGGSQQLNYVPWPPLPWSGALASAGPILLEQFINLGNKVTVLPWI